MFHGLSVTEKLFGILESDTEHFILKNQFLLVVKRYIYLQLVRCGESFFSVRAFNNSEGYQEARTHKQKGKLALRYQKWSIVMQ